MKKFKKIVILSDFCVIILLYFNVVNYLPTERGTIIMSKRTCNVCGREVNDNVVFCPDCGNNSFTTVEEPEQPAYQQPEQPAYQQPEQPQYQQPAQPQYQQPQYQQQYQPAYQNPQYSVTEKQGKSIASLILGIISFLAALPVFNLSLSFITGNKTDQYKYAYDFGKMLGNTFKDTLTSAKSMNDLMALLKGIIIGYGMVIIIPAVIGAILGILGLKNKKKGIAIAGLILCGISLIIGLVYIINMMNAVSMMY